jgi:ribosomal protein S18 acetylase RimI-like enzyme
MIKILPFSSFPEQATLFEKLAALDQVVLISAGPAYDEHAWTTREFSYPLPQKAALSFAVVQEDAFIGFSVGYAFTGSWHHISRVAIHPEQTGKGIAKKLLNLQLEAMRQFTPKLISVDTKQNNTAAVKLYESLGFAILQGPDLEAYVNLRNREPEEYLGAQSTHFALVNQIDPNFKFNIT